MRCRPLLSAALLASGLFIGVIGCVSDQFNEFRGSLARENKGAVERTYQLHGPFERTVDDASDALRGFGVDQYGSIIFVYDKQGVIHNGGRLSTDAIKSVYYMENDPRQSEMWADFLRKDDAGREATAGIERLRGRLDVERWKSETDFRIQIDMHVNVGSPLRIQGEMTFFERWSFDPMVWTSEVLFPPFDSFVQNVLHP